MSKDWMEQVFIAVKIKARAADKEKVSLRQLLRADYWISNVFANEVVVIHRATATSSYFNAQFAALECPDEHRARFEEFVKKDSAKRWEQYKDAMLAAA